MWQHSSLLTKYLSNEKILHSMEKISENQSMVFAVSDRREKKKINSNQGSCWQSPRKVMGLANEQKPVVQLSPLLWRCGPWQDGTLLPIGHPKIHHQISQSTRELCHPANPKHIWLYLKLRTRISTNSSWQKTLVKVPLTHLSVTQIVCMLLHSKWKQMKRVIRNASGD